MSSKTEIKFISSIQQIPKATWQALVKSDCPFIQYEFLASLEQSEVVAGSSGWEPHHLVYALNDEIIAVAPGYIKYHSYGEYVFDFEWAAAYDRHGLNYYPKYVTAIPFTPVTADRIFIAKKVNQSQAIETICAAIKAMLAKQKMSSWHILFPKASESALLTENGVCQRLGAQYHWQNKGYACFDEFLSGMNKKQRKNIKRERASLAKSAVEIVRCEGDQITEPQIEQFYQFYCMTYAKRSGHYGYLNLDFFKLMVSQMPQYLMFAFALKDQQIIAGAMFFKDSQTLYGRYWGCLVEVEFLHFELCYYQGIEYAIKHNLKKFDAGAQGEHKITRGFEPCKTYSNHYMVESNFSMAIEHFVEQEQKMVESRISQLAKKLPFKNKKSMASESPR